MRRNLRWIGAIALVIGGVGLTVILRGTLSPMATAGPLALVEPQPGSPQSRTEGVLEITDDCVLLVHPDGTRSLVVWSSGSVSWDATDRSVAVTGNGGDVTLRGGDAVAMTGGGGPAATLDRAGTWVQRPHETCSAPEWFLAVDVRVAEQD